MIDQKLFTFLKMAECMNTTECALALHITQPAVSQHLKALEQYYHVDLFRHEGRKLALTPAGKRLYQSARRLVTMEQKIAADLLQPSPTRISFGATLSISAGLMPAIFPVLLKKWPEIRFDYITQNTSVLLEQLESGLIDFALIEGNFSQQHYAFSAFREEKFSCLCAPGSPFANLCSLHDCLNVPIFLRKSGSGSRDIFEHECMLNNLSLSDFHQIHEIESVPLIMQLAKEGLGITFAYECAAAESMKKGSLQTVPLKNFPLVHNFSFVTLPDIIKHPLLLELQKGFQSFAV